MSDAADQEKPLLFRFGDFTLDVKRRGLYRDQDRVHLTSKPLETLILLVERRGRVVEKQELMDRIWKDTFVTEDNLVHAIREIRRALEDDKANPRFIQTVPRQGYRFIGEVSSGEAIPTSPPADKAGAASGARQNRGPRRWFWISGSLVLVVIALAGIFLARNGKRLLSSSGPKSPALGAERQITTGEFYSGKPAFSSDGRFILYTSSSVETRGHGDIFIKQFPEGNAQRITNQMDPSGDLPVFTADARNVVFSVARMAADGARHHDLWIVPSFGGPVSRFLEDASGAGFSPNEKWVGYTKHLDSQNALWVSPTNNLQEHYELSAQGFTPRWSPDGKWVAYTTSNPNGGVGDIRICSVSGSSEGKFVASTPRQLTKETEEIYGLAWTADSKSIIFSSKRTGPSQLYKVSLSNGSTAPLLSGVGQYIAPSVSPNGNTIIFQYFRLTNDLMTISLEANCEARNITFDQFHSSPRISPAGKKLASVIKQIDNTERPYLIDLKTREGSKLIDRPARHPCWLDDDNVAFLSSDAASENTDVLVVNTVTRESNTLTSFRGKADWVAIHPDRKRLAVVMKGDGYRERILLRDLISQTDSTIDEGSEYEYLRWSPDGAHLCWDRPGASRNAPQTSGGIWMITIGKSGPQLLVKDGYCPVWNDDGSAIYFVTRQGQPGLWRYDLSQRTQRLVCNWQTVFNYDLVGSRVIFAQHKNNSQVYSAIIRHDD